MEKKKNSIIFLDILKSAPKQISFFIDMYSMHHQGHETTEVGGDHFRSTGVKLWPAVQSVMPKKEQKILSNFDVEIFDDGTTQIFPTSVLRFLYHLLTKIDQQYKDTSQW